MSKVVGHTGSDPRVIEALTGSIPGPRALSLLQEVFAERLKAAGAAQSVEPIRDFVRVIGPLGTWAVLRRLDSQARAEIITLDLSNTNLRAVSSYHLTEQVFNSSSSRIDLHDVVSKVGKEVLNGARTPAGTAVFGGTVLLAEAAVKLMGIEFLPEVNGASGRQLTAALQDLGSILQSNANVFRRFQGSDLVSSPLALNAEQLNEQFCFRREDLLSRPVIRETELRDFVRGWRERVKIHTNSGVGIYDRPDLALRAEEIEEIGSGFAAIPASIFLFQGVLMRLDFTEPAQSDRGLGGYKLGRALIFPAARTAIAGLDTPTTASPFKYATIHECAHCCHTLCMPEFEALSGWKFVRDGIVRAAYPGGGIKVSRSDLQPGKKLCIEGDDYVVAEYEQSKFHQFAFGDEAIEFADMYDSERCRWLYRVGSRFVTDYAALEPIEDYAESLANFILSPDLLMKRAPEKFEFMKLLYGR